MNRNRKLAKNVIKVTKKDLIKDIAGKTNVKPATIKKVYELLEIAVCDKLSSASRYNDISVKIFDGLYLSSSYIPQHTQVNKLTGQYIEEDKVRVKSRTVKTLEKKINDMMALNSIGA